MKKLLFIALCLLSTVSFAQSKGDHYFSGTLGFEFGTQKTKLAVGSISESASSPLAASFSIGAEYGHFVCKNFKLGIGLYLPYSYNPLQKHNDEWLKSTTFGVGVNPNISYYVRINDYLYYTPELGGLFEYGNYSEDLSDDSTYKTNCIGWGVYLSLLSFEVKVSDDYALGFSMGALEYSAARIKNKEIDTKLTTSVFKCNFSKASIHFRAYF